MKSVPHFRPALLCLFCSLFETQVHAQKPSQNPAPQSTKSTKSTKTNPKLDARAGQEMVARVLRETSALRGLAVKSPVKSAVKTRAEVEKMLRGKVRDELPSDQVVATELVLRQLGLVPARFGLQSTYIAMMGEQIAGYYDTKTKSFTTTDRTDALQLEVVMAHELTHALQDQHFDLSRLEKWPEHDSDAKLAMSALVEGDATLLMSLYMRQKPLLMVGALASSLKAQGSSPTFNAAPRVLRDTVTFPYLNGLEFAGNLFRRGGWKAVSDAFERLPQSSEQILHFDKYLAREAPQKVVLRDLSRDMGPGWKLLDHDVNGEIGQFLTVAEHLGDDTAARNAAAGWAGDRYQVYRGPKNVTLVVQDCRWDSQFDARQWRETYAKRTAKRFGIAARKRGALEVWNAAPDGVWMEQRGQRVLILEGTIGAFNPATVMSALWKGR